jgi:hypothetical protein
MRFALLRYVAADMCSLTALVNVVEAAGGQEAARRIQLTATARLLEMVQAALGSSGALTCRGDMSPQLPDALSGEGVQHSLRPQVPLFHPNPLFDGCIGSVLSTASWLTRATGAAGYEAGYEGEGEHGTATSCTSTDHHYHDVITALHQQLRHDLRLTSSGSTQQLRWRKEM